METLGCWSKSLQEHNIKYTMALDAGSRVANEFVHTSKSPITAANYVAALSPQGSSACVVKIDLCKLLNQSIVDVSTIQQAMSHGLSPQSMACFFVIVHQIVLLSSSVPA